MKIENFTDLIAWKEGHKLVLDIYKITSLFPKTESYALTDQTKRATTSITSNIAEGFSRRSSKEKLQFYYIALGSSTELQNQLMMARDLSYVRKEKFDITFQQIIVVRKLIFGLIRSLKTAES